MSLDPVLMGLVGLCVAAYFAGYVHGKARGALEELKPKERQR